jgi:large subunit ribosomal protein L4
VRSALTTKAAAERIVVLDQLAVDSPRTREMAQVVQNVIGADVRVLILMAQADENVERSSNNLPAVKLLRANYLNVRDLLNYEYVVIPQSALAVIQEIWGEQEEVA